MSSGRANVCLWPKADLTLLNFDVRFTPESGHSSPPSRCQLWARNELMQCSKLPSFDHFVGGGEQRLGPTIVLSQARRGGRPPHRPD